MEYVAKIYTDFPDKFGIPRQSGLIDLKGKILFEPEYRTLDCIRGIEEYSHIWILWEFSENKDAKKHLTVRPPRLGGNVRKGVFATRSPFRPNNIGLSLVRLEKVELDEKLGPVLYVSGVDMKNETPILDIKPYLPYCEAIPDAKGGFASQVKDYHLDVEIPDDIGAVLTEEEISQIREILAEDPRPSYQDDPERMYGMNFKNMEIHFRVENHKAVLCNINRSEL